MVYTASTYLAHRRSLAAGGPVFQTGTGAEGHLPEKYFAGNLEEAARAATNKISGGFPLAVISRLAGRLCRGLRAAVVVRAGRR